MTITVNLKALALAISCVTGVLLFIALLAISPLFGAFVVGIIIVGSIGALVYFLYTFFEGEARKREPPK